MLVLTRKLGEEILIGDDIVLKVTAMQGGRVRIGIDAPKHHRIVRSEADDRKTPSVNTRELAAV